MAELNMSFIILLFLSLISGYKSSDSICHIRSSPKQPLFIESIQNQCPLSISPIYPLKVDGFSLDRKLMDTEGNKYTAILFYASWCPFSHGTRLTFEALSSMFPQIQHLAVEQADALPSTFSRYGIHSLPSILVVNKTSKMRFRGSKDIHSLVRFYQKITGFEPVHYVDPDQFADLVSNETLIKPLWIDSSFYKLIQREPYLLFAALFIILRMFFASLPIMISKLRAFWELYVPQLNLEIFGEGSQMLGRARNMINVKRIWEKMWFCKTRNFHEGAKNATVWASSLASVSLGKASSSRSTS